MRSHDSLTQQETSLVLRELVCVPANAPRGRIRASQEVKACFLCAALTASDSNNLDNLENEKTSTGSARQLAPLSISLTGSAEATAED